MRVFTAIFCLLILFNSGVVAQDTAEDRKSRAIVRERLLAESRQLQSHSYRQTGALKIELVDRGKIQSFAFTLADSTAYALIATCDNDCTHVQVYFRDQSDQILVVSPEEHHTVVVNGSPQQRGRHFLDVSAPGCSEDSCYVGVALLELSALKSPSPEAPRVAGVAIPADPASAFSSFDNYDGLGRDLREPINSELEGCASACLSDVRCIGYTFDKWNRMCFLKAAVSELRLEPKSSTALRTGMARPAVTKTAIEMRRLPGKAFPWAGQEASRIAAFEDCEERCEEEATCVAFTYFKAKRLCRLMKTTGEYFADASADSGLKRQPPN